MICSSDAFGLARLAAQQIEKASPFYRVVLHRRRVEAIALIVGGLAVDQVVGVRAVDPVPDLEGSVDEEVVGRVVLAGAVVVCAAHTEHR